MPGAVLPRYFAALPDSITAAVFLVAWVAPNVPGPEQVNHLMDSMPIEFIVMHSSVFYAGLAAADGIARNRRLAMLTGLTALYSTFILGYALVDHSAWPVFAFAWLFASRFAHIWTQPVQNIHETKRMFVLWVVSGVAFTMGAWTTAVIPLPRLGMTAQFVASLHLSGSGVWIERPQTVLAFGVVYFAILAAAKYALSASAPQNEGAAQMPGGAADTPLESRLREIVGLIGKTVRGTRDG